MDRTVGKVGFAAQDPAFIEEQKQNCECCECELGRMLAWTQDAIDTMPEGLDTDFGPSLKGVQDSLIAALVAFEDTCFWKGGW